MTPRKPKGANGITRRLAETGAAYRIVIPASGIHHLRGNPGDVYIVRLETPIERAAREEAQKERDATQRAMED